MLGFILTCFDSLRKSFIQASQYFDTLPLNITLVNSFMQKYLDKIWSTLLFELPGILCTQRKFPQIFQLVLLFSE